MSTIASDKTTELYFIRHAEADNTCRDDRSRPLTPRGHRDADLLAMNLACIEFDRLYSSPYKRAIHTIMPLAIAQGVGVEVIEDFRERKPAGYWVEDFWEFTERQWADFSFRLEGGESLFEVQERCINVLTAMCRKIPGKTAAIATHGTALAVILNRFDPGFGYERYLELLPKTPHVIRLEFRGTEYIGSQTVCIADDCMRI